MQPASIGLCILLLLTANGIPILLADILKSRCSYPLDGGLRFIDQRPWLGRSKTWRGVIASLLATMLVASLLGLHWQLGLAFAALAMVGDVAASFIKRRLAIGESERAWLLDQLPESLLPLYLLKNDLAITMPEVFVAAAGFTLVDMLLSPLLYRLHLRKRPY